jgi:DNA-directed RNA polymerase specialized sigma24 family protein
MRAPGRRSAPRGPEIKSRADVEKVARFVEAIVARRASDACRRRRRRRCTDVADRLGEGDDDQGPDDAEDRADRRHQEVALPASPVRFPKSGRELGLV